MVKRGIFAIVLAGIFLVIFLAGFGSALAWMYTDCANSGGYIYSNPSGHVSGNSICNAKGMTCTKGYKNGNAAYSCTNSDTSLTDACCLVKSTPVPLNNIFHVEDTWASTCNCNGCPAGSVMKTVACSGTNKCVSGNVQQDYWSPWVPACISCGASIRCPGCTINYDCQCTGNCQWAGFRQCPSDNR